MFKNIILFASLICLAMVLIGCNDKVENIESPNEEENTQWNESPLFTSNSIEMIGEKGRIGFIYNDDEVTRFYPKKEQKYMWHFWGDADEFKGEFKVLGTHESDKDSQIVVLRYDTLGGSNNGADKHLPSNFSLPYSGMWKLDAYFGNYLFGTIYVKVHEK